MGGLFMNDIPLSQMIVYLLPLILVHFGLAIYCLFDILRNGVKNLNKAAWILIVFVIEIFGSVAYLIMGRKGYSE
jgi:hypothetical protein